MTEDRSTDPSRYVCTADAPWSPEKGERAVHPDAVDDGGCSDSCCDDYRCPHCGLCFRVHRGDA
jgi:hypothetical protein